MMNSYKKFDDYFYFKNESSVEIVFSITKSNM